MNMQAIDEAVIECERFLVCTDALKEHVEHLTDDLSKGNEENPSPADPVRSAEYHVFSGTRESGAVKRASMDLSRALVKLR